MADRRKCALLMSTGEASSTLLSSLSSPLDALCPLSSWLARSPNAPRHSGWTWHCWLCSYLVHIIPDKSHLSVIWNGSLPKPCFLETGVPQGLILGRLLFSLYTRSLGSAVTSHRFSCYCYADDTQVFLSFPQSSSSTHTGTRISECLADITAWTAAHHLKLNLSKTELLFIPGKWLLSHCPNSPIYLQTLVRPHTPTRALCCTTSAGRIVQPSLRLKKTCSANSSLFLHLINGMSSWPMSGEQSHSPSSAKRLKTHLFRLYLNPA